MSSQESDFRCDKVRTGLKCWSLRCFWSKVIAGTHTAWLEEKNMDREKLMTLIKKRAGADLDE